MTAKLPSSEPQAERAIRRVLPLGEEILWAARSRGPTWRQWHIMLLRPLFVGWIVFLILRTPGADLLSFFFASLAALLIWALLGDWFYVFAVTSRRVIMLRTFWPRSWMFADCNTIDPGWVRINVGRGKIQFSGIEISFVPSGWWSGLVSRRGRMREYIDNVPDIEAVRALILERITAAQATQNASPRSEIKIPPPTENRWIKTTNS